MRFRFFGLCAVLTLTLCVFKIWAQPATTHSAHVEGIHPALLSKAKAGDAKAEYQLGKVYYDGKDVRQNYAQAAVWFRKAAYQGNPDAEYMLGGMYHYGLGVPKNSAEGVSWLKKAAGQGQAKADYLLATCYSEGWGVPKSDAQAVVWLRKGAALGNEDSQYMLGWAYERGIGTLPDYAKAYFWLDIVALGRVKGNDRKEALERRNEAASHLSPSELSSVQERARKWFDAHSATTPTP